MDETNNKPKLRIAFLDSWLQSAAEGSGTAVAIGGLGNELQRQGHEVERIAPPAGGWWRHLPLTLRRLIFNVLLPLQQRHARFDLVVGFDWDGVFWRARGWGREMRGRQGDRETRRQGDKEISNGQAGSYHSSLVTPPYICSIKGVIAEELQHERGRIRLLFQLLSRLEGANARRVDRVITTSDYCRRKIVEHYGVPIERIGIVPEGIDLAAWSSNGVRDQGLGDRDEDEAGQPRNPTPVPQPLRILCVARQYPRKHIDDLLRAFALIHERVPDAQLHIVGDGPEHEKLVALAQQLHIAPKTAFTGSISDEDVRQAYEQCDIFCLPSVQEGFGIVFLEAMAAGKPVISTTAAAIPEVVQHGTTGVLVPPGDVRALAGALLLLLTDDERRKRYGAAGREHVHMYDWQRVAEQFLREVTRILEPQRRREAQNM